MKKTISSCALVGGCCLGLLAMPQLGRSQGFYFEANAGGAIAANVDVNKFIVSTPGAKLKLNAGPQFSVAGGYFFNEYLGAQIESGYIYNAAENAGGNATSLSHVPMLVDVVLRYDKSDCKWVPYLGAGAGGDVSILNLDYVTAPNGLVVDGASSTVVFAWQAFAGLRYKFDEKMSIGAGYKYYSANGGTWDVQNTSGNIDFGTARVQSVGIDFSMKF